jgi:hypothetical protein
MLAMYYWGDFFLLLFVCTIVQALVIFNKFGYGFGYDCGYVLKLLFCKVPHRGNESMCEITHSLENQERPLNG